MVKVRDLSDPQLDQQLKKYQKLVDELSKEKDRRLKGANPKVKVDPDAAIATSEFQLNLDEQEIASMNKEAKKAESKKMDDEEVRVTQLLQLNSGQLKELQKNAEKLRAQELKKKEASKK